MVKRERDGFSYSGTPPSDSASEYHADARSPSPQPDVKPIKKAKVTKKAGNGGGGGTGKWDGAAYVRVLEAALDCAAKNLDMDALAEELGVGKRHVREQLIPNRSNLRKLAIQLVIEKKGAQ